MMFLVRTSAPCLSLRPQRIASSRCVRVLPCCIVRLCVDRQSYAQSLNSHIKHRQGETKRVHSLSSGEGSEQQLRKERCGGCACIGSALLGSRTNATAALFACLLAVVLH
eukprot:4496-Heterococcus_DN1.PRE.3